MEPRPQRPRSTPGQTPSGSTPPTQGAQVPPYQQPGDVDPTAFIAPPRTEYDYSPLDLAPPSQRRKRQLVVAIVGVLALVVIGALVVLGYLFLDDGNDDDGLDELARAQTVIAATTVEATGPASPSEGNATTDGTADAGTAANPTETPTTESAGDGEATTAPTTASSEPTTEPTAAAGPSVEDLTALLPEDADLPVQGLDVVEDSEATEEDVAGAIGGNRAAETNLEKWGWSGNVGRTFSASDPTLLDATATTYLRVSVHGFSSATNAKDALDYFSGYLADSGWTELDDPGVGDASLMLQQEQEDGTIIVSLYVQKGQVMYLIQGGAQGGGDPSENVVALAQTIIGD